jgi:phospholipase C
MHGDFTLSGSRVPLMVVSPFVKPHFVSHTNRELTSILKLIETRFNLPALTRRDAAADDMTEFFDFINPPAFLTPPPLPAQPTTGLDDLSKEAPPQ